MLRRAAGLSQPALWGLAAVLLLAAVALDSPVRSWALDWRASFPARLWAQAAYLAGLGWVQAVALGCLALAGRWRGRMDLWGTGWAGLLAILLSGVAVQAVKHLVGRPRPGVGLSPWLLKGLTFDSDWHSFPSGHSATSFAVAAVLAARWPRAAWAFYLGAALVASGRVVGGSHYPSDVVGGAVLGLLVGLFLVRRLEIKDGGEA